MIRHFTHPHPLTLSKPPWIGATYGHGACNLCQKKFHESDQIYRCPQMLTYHYGRESCFLSIEQITNPRYPCEYYVHISCAQSQEQISHPLHPGHKLSLLKAKHKSYFRCSACGDHNYSKSRYNYYCDECEYRLDLKCAALTPIKIHENPINHQHPLVLCDKPKGNDYHYDCHFCREDFQDYDRVYVCQECHCLLHESCADLPREVRHPFHLDHPLILFPVVTGMSGCDVCHEPCDSGTFLYHCSFCRFSIDVHCASLMPRSKNSNFDASQEHLLIQPIAYPHPHPLIQCDSIKNFRRLCFGCNLPFEDFIYSCLECGVLLHKHCADLPPEIVHPFHPQHTLILGIDWGYRCQGCHKTSGKLVYSCKKCRICLDLKCAQAKPHLIMISQVHKHALAFIDFETETMRCNICGEICNKFFFRCVECDYNVHDHCYPLLPQTLKHECHCDPLTLHRSIIKDLSDESEEEEFYCYACEELRYLSHPTYYCADCRFVSHVHCVISEILSYLDRESIALANKVENTKLETSMKTKTVTRRKAYTRRKATDTENPVNKSTSIATAEVAKPKVDPVLHELNERIAALENEVDAKTKEIARLKARLENEVDAITEEIAILKARRAQHIASGVSP